ncbi:hypothetical protein ACLOJK_026774 [Asimina triloba]
MHPLKPVEEEFPGSTSSSSSSPPMAPPRPMEGLYEQGPPPFLTKTYDMVDDPSTNRVVSWSSSNSSFVGFRKVHPDRWEFANEAFIRGQKHLLKNIKRRRTPSQATLQEQALGPFVEAGQFGLDAEIDWLRRDKNILMMELVKMRQKQQQNRVVLQAMEERLQGTEQKQQQIMAFLARAMQNPTFLQQLLQQKEKRKEIEKAISKKRRRSIDMGHSGGESSQSRDPETVVKTELPDFEGLYGSEVSELEVLALEMQGIRRTQREEAPEEQEQHEQEDEENELNDDFWEELLNEKFGDEKGTSDIEGREDEDVNVLTDRLGYLGSSPKLQAIHGRVPGIHGLIFLMLRPFPARTPLHAPLDYLLFGGNADDDGWARQTDLQGGGDFVATSVGNHSAGRLDFYVPDEHDDIEPPRPVMMLTFLYVLVPLTRETFLSASPRPDSAIAFIISVAHDSS